jgi:hypothetical protein
VPMTAITTGIITNVPGMTAPSATSTAIDRS